MLGSDHKDRWNSSIIFVRMVSYTPMVPHQEDNGIVTLTHHRLDFVGDVFVDKTVLKPGERA
jgi:hypothetical protein